MLIRKANPGEGPVCDALLTRLIQTERQWEPNLNEDFIVTNNYAYRMAEDGTLLLVAEENSEVVGFLFGVLSTLPRCKSGPPPCWMLCLCVKRTATKASARRWPSGSGSGGKSKVFTP